MTFSVAGRDPRTGDISVAVASKFLAVGALVPFVKSGVGAVATQSYVNPNFGPDGLALRAGRQRKTWPRTSRHRTRTSGSGNSGRWTFRGAARP